MKINFMDSKSKMLEQCAKQQFLSFSVSLRDVLHTAAQTIPDRIKLIKSKSAISGDDEDLLDQIGVDFLFCFMGCLFAVDVTTGSSTVIKNKKRKMLSINKFLEEINAVPVVLTVRDGWTNRSMIEAIIRAPVCQKTGVIDCRMY